MEQNELLSFSAADLNMWGPGQAFTIDETFQWTLFDFRPAPIAPSIGFSTSGAVQTGVSLAASANAHAGAAFAGDIRGSSGDMDIAYPISVSVQTPDAVSPGQLAKIDTANWQVLGADFKTESPSLSAHLDFIYHLGAGLDATLKIDPLTLDTWIGEIDLSDAYEKKLYEKAWGQADDIKISLIDIESGRNQSMPIAGLDGNTVAVFEAGLPATIMGDDAAQTIAPNTLASLSVSGITETAFIALSDVDIDGLLFALLGRVPNPGVRAAVEVLSRANEVHQDVSFSPVQLPGAELKLDASFDWELIDIKGSVGIKFAQEFSFQPRSVAVTMISEYGEKHTGRLGDAFYFYVPENDADGNFDVSAEYRLLGTIHNQSGIVGTGSVSVKTVDLAATGTVTVDLPVADYQASVAFDPEPLFAAEISADTRPWYIYDQQFDISSSLAPASASYRIPYAPAQDPPAPAEVTNSNPEDMDHAVTDTASSGVTFSGTGRGWVGYYSGWNKSSNTMLGDNFHRDDTGAYVYSPAADVLVGGSYLISGVSDSTVYMATTYLFGGGGNDSISGSDVYGGAGDDLIVGGPENNVLYGDYDPLLGSGIGDDTIAGGAGDDEIYGGEGSDKLYGDAGNDTIEGSGILHGNDGNDFVTGTGRLYGDAGVDHVRSKPDFLSADILFGGSGDDVLDANGGDIAYGGAGNDTLEADVQAAAGSDADTMYGDEGADTLYGSSRGEFLYGGSGNDILVGGSGNDWLEGNSDDSVGDDPLAADFLGDDLDGGEGDDKLYGGEGNDRLTDASGVNELSGGNGNDSIFGNAAGEDRSTLDGGAGNDTIEGGTHSLLYGGEGNDKLTARAESLLDGGPGNDVLTGLGSGHIYALGGDGDDTIDISLMTLPAGEAEGSVIFAGSGNDTVTGGVGDDTIDGGDGDDTLSGGSGANVITGGAGRDSLTGGSGNDTLDGGADDDRMVGGSGDDLYIVDNSLDLVVESAGQGVDRIEASVSYTFGGDIEFFALIGDLALNATGSYSANTIFGNEHDNVLKGLHGADTLYGGGGRDTFLYAWNSTTVAHTHSTLSATDYLADFDADDQIELVGIAGIAALPVRYVFQASVAATTSAIQQDAAIANAAVLFSDGNDDYVYIKGIGTGTNYNGTLIKVASGTLAPSQLAGIPALPEVAIVAIDATKSEGESGAYAFEVTRGGDTTGASTLDWSVSGEATAADFGGVLPSGSLTFAAGESSKTLTVYVSADSSIEGNESFTVTLAGAANAFLVADHADGSILNDDAGSVELDGSADADAIVGSGAPENLLGFAGADRLAGAGGNDTLDGGAGADLVQGEAGNDMLFLSVDGIWGTGFAAINDGSPGVAGSAQRISLAGRNKFEDVTDGGEGTDTASLTAGNDAFFLHDAHSLFESSVALTSDSRLESSAARSARIDQILAGDGDDLVDLTSLDYQIGATMIDGGSGDDILWAGGGADHLIGGSGNDTLFGGAGNDTLEGGPGADLFQFVAENGQDTIVDFQAGVDTIQLFGATRLSEVQLSLYAGHVAVTWHDNILDLIGVTSMAGAEAWFAYG